MCDGDFSATLNMLMKPKKGVALKCPKEYIEKSTVFFFF